MLITRILKRSLDIVLGILGLAIICVLGFGAFLWFRLVETYAAIFPGDQDD